MLNLRRVIGQHIHASKGPLFVARDGFENSTFGSEKTNLFVSCGFSPGHIPIGYFDRGNANVSVNGSRRVVVDSHKYDLTHKFGLNHYEKFSYAASDVMSELILLVNAFEKHAEKTITTFRVDGREKESHVIATENLQDVKGGQLIAIDEHGAFMGIIAKQDDEFYFSDFVPLPIENSNIHLLTKTPLPSVFPYPLYLYHRKIHEYVVLYQSK